MIGTPEILRKDEMKNARRLVQAALMRWMMELASEQDSFTNDLRLR